MKLLAVDTSSNACSVAIKDGESLFTRHVVEAKAHTRILLPMIRELLSEAELELSDLDGLVLGNGPGSFIGMRIGASVVQGLAFATGLTIVPVSSLAAIAAEVFSEHEVDRVVVAQDARMNEVYLGLFEKDSANNNCLGSSNFFLPVSRVEERLHAITRIDALADSGKTWATAGGGWQRYPTLLEENEPYLSKGCPVTVPNARALLDIGLTGMHAGNDIAPEQLQPAYLRNQVATPPK